MSSIKFNFMVMMVLLLVMKIHSGKRFCPVRTEDDQDVLCTEDTDCELYNTVSSSAICISYFEDIDKETMRKTISDEDIQIAIELERIWLRDEPVKQKHCVCQSGTKQYKLGDPCKGTAEILFERQEKFQQDSKNEIKDLHIKLEKTQEVYQEKVDKALETTRFTQDARIQDLKEDKLLAQKREENLLNRPSESNQSWMKQQMQILRSDIVFSMNYPKKPFQDTKEYARCINIAVVGLVKAGKSTFINSIRDLKSFPNEDPSGGPNRAITGGSGEVTIASQEFKYEGEKAKTMEEVRWWDCPGVCTKRFPPDTYIQDVAVRWFDLVILLSKGMWKTEDARIYADLVRNEIPFIIVRNNINQDMAEDDIDFENDEQSSKYINGGKETWEADFDNYPNEHCKGFYIVSAKLIHENERWNQFKQLKKKLQELIEIEQDPETSQRMEKRVMRNNWM